MATVTVLHQNRTDLLLEELDVFFFQFLRGDGTGKAHDREYNHQSLHQQTPANIGDLCHLCHYQTRGNSLMHRSLILQCQPPGS